MTVVLWRCELNLDRRSLLSQRSPVVQETSGYDIGHHSTQTCQVGHQEDQASHQVSFQSRPATRLSHPHTHLFAMSSMLAGYSQSHNSVSASSRSVIYYNYVFDTYINVLICRTTQNYINILISKSLKSHINIVLSNIICRSAISRV